MTSRTGFIAGINLLLLLGWTVYCRSLVSAGNTELLNFSVPMAAGIGGLLFLNLLGAIGANMSNELALRNSFGTAILLVLLIGFGLCGLAAPH